MIIKCGVDLVYLPRFKKSLKKGGENFLRRVYRKEELKKNNPEHLAGIFAAKEAVIKALSLPVDSWQDILITYKRSGTPEVKFLNHKSLILNHSLSISHDGNYVIAYFVAIMK
jgi:phosphopantetheine--protein transferase-like protein